MPERNPLAWIFGGLLAVSLYGNYSTGNKLSQVCSFLSEGIEQSVRFERTQWQTVEHICAERDDRQTELGHF
jgi:hypothetical protein